jgi:hypothetical protein
MPILKIAEQAREEIKGFRLVRDKRHYTENQSDSNRQPADYQKTGCGNLVNAVLPGREAILPRKIGRAERRRAEQIRSHWNASEHKKCPRSVQAVRRCCPARTSRQN